MRAQDRTSTLTWFHVGCCGPQEIANYLWIYCSLAAFCFWYMATINSIDKLFVEEIPADWFRTAHSEPQAWRPELVHIWRDFLFYIFDSSTYRSAINHCTYAMDLWMLSTFLEQKIGLESRSLSLCVSEILTCQLVNFSCSFLIGSPSVRWWWRAMVWWPWLWMHPSVVPRSGNPVATLFARDFCYHHQALLQKSGTASKFRSIDMHYV